VTLCGIRGGSPYVNVTRVNLKTRECPTGLFPCSDATSADHTVCYRKEMLNSSCPLTEIKFTYSFEPEGQTYLNDDKYRIQKVGSQNMATTQTAINH